MAKKAQIVKASRLLSLHRSFDKKTKAPIWWVGENGKVTKMSGDAITHFLEAVTDQLTIRLTGLGYFLYALKEMQDRGARMVYAHWHATDLKKGLDEESIVLAFLSLPEEIFHDVTIRNDLARLRVMVGVRNAVVDYRKAVTLKLIASTRALGYEMNDENLPEDIKEESVELKKASALTETSRKKDQNGEYVGIEAKIAELGATIPECVLLKDIMNVKDSWITAAAVVGLLGDMVRFQTVQSVWHYCGYHVVDGSAPKRVKGENISWNPKLRTALWSWSDSMLKTKNPRWRPVYDAYLAEELAVHDEKHPDCKTVQGHCGARARRRVVKDILKEYFLTVRGIEIKVADAEPMAMAAGV